MKDLTKSDEKTVSESTEQSLGPDKPGMTIRGLSVKNKKEEMLTSVQDSVTGNRTSEGTEKDEERYVGESTHDLSFDVNFLSAISVVTDDESRKPIDDTEKDEEGCGNQSPEPVPNQEQKKPGMNYRELPSQDKQKGSIQSDVNQLSKDKGKSRSKNPGVNNRSLNLKIQDDQNDDLQFDVNQLFDPHLVTGNGNSELIKDTEKDEENISQGTQQALDCLEGSCARYWQEEPQRSIDEFSQSAANISNIVQSPETFSKMTRRQLYVDMRSALNIHWKTLSKEHPSESLQQNFIHVLSSCHKIGSLAHNIISDLKYKKLIIEQCPLKVVGKAVWYGRQSALHMVTPAGFSAQDERVPNFTHIFTQKCFGANSDRTIFEHHIDCKILELKNGQQHYSIK